MILDGSIVVLGVVVFDHHVGGKDTLLRCGFHARSVSTAIFVEIARARDLALSVSHPPKILARRASASTLTLVHPVVNAPGAGYHIAYIQQWHVLFSQVIGTPCVLFFLLLQYKRLKEYFREPCLNQIG